MLEARLSTNESPDVVALKKVADFLGFDPKKVLQFMANDTDRKELRQLYLDKLKTLRNQIGFLEQGKENIPDYKKPYIIAKNNEMRAFFDAGIFTTILEGDDLNVIFPPVPKRK